MKAQAHSQYQGISKKQQSSIRYQVSCIMYHDGKNNRRKIRPAEPRQGRRQAQRRLGSSLGNSKAAWESGKEESLLQRRGLCCPNYKFNKGNTKEIHHNTPHGCYKPSPWKLLKADKNPFCLSEAVKIRNDKAEREQRTGRRNNE